MYRGERTIAKNRNTFAKRQREHEKRAKAQEKRARRTIRKLNGESNSIPEPPDAEPENITE